MSIYTATDDTMTDPLEQYTSSQAEQSFSKQIDFSSGWTYGDGNYKARLQVGSCQAFVYFDVAIAQDKNELECKISDLHKITYDDNQLPITPRPSMQKISTGLYSDLQGKAWHSDLPDNVKFMLMLYDDSSIRYDDSGVLYYNDSGFYKNITPGFLDETGYARGPVGDGGQNGFFGTLDLTSVPNGIYTLVLNVKCHDMSGTDQVEIAIENPLKIGNVKFSQEDMTIPVGGMPIRVVRTYDSFRKDKDGDFGHGWSYSFANMDIKLNETRWPAGSHTERIGGEFDRDVTLTLPDGRRVTFTSYLEGYCGLTGSWDVKYHLPEGVTGIKSFIAAGGNTIVGDFVWGWYWEDYPPDSCVYTSDLSLHDFPGFELHMDDGTVYNIKRKQYPDQEIIDDLTDWCMTRFQPYGKPYLESIYLPSGEKIEFCYSDTINWEKPICTRVDRKDSLGTVTRSLKIIRDSYTGRITEIRSPADVIEDTHSSLKYGYDSYGNLTSVSKLVFKDDPENSGQPKYETTTYVYDDHAHNPADHYVTNIEDPRGLSPIRYVYNDEGRLIGTIDAKGNMIEIQHDITGNAERVIDRLGNVTDYFYNDRGNVGLVIKDPDGENQQTEYVYDEDGKYPDLPITVSQRIALPDIWADTVTSYDANGRPKIVWDPLFNVTTYLYDNSGNLTETTQWLPSDTVSSTEDFPSDYPDIAPNSSKYTEVSTTINTYYYRDGDGTLVEGYQSGCTHTNLLAWTTVIKGGTTYSESANFYDNKNRLISTEQIDPTATLASVVNSYAYAREDGVDPAYRSGVNYSPYPQQPYRVTDPTGVHRYSEYNANGSLVYSYYKWIDPDNATNSCIVCNESVYDAIGRVIQSKRHIQEATGDRVNSTQVLSTTAYNSIGKVEYVEDEQGNKTEYYYDELGNNVETWTWTPAPTPDGTYLSYSQTLYDKEGRVLLSLGPVEYDATSPAEAVGTENVYDSLGRVIKTRRWANVSIDYVQVTAENNEIYLTLPESTEPCNAWGTNDGETGDPPAEYLPGWTANSILPVAGNELSYSRAEYDVAGRVKRTFTQNEVGEEICTNEYEYDLAGKQKKVIMLPDDPEKRAETITEYQGNRRWKVTDARNNTTEYVYDALGRVTTTIHPPVDLDGDGTIEPETETTYTHVGYDGLGRKWWQSEQTIQDTAESLTADEIKQFEYDVVGRLTATILPPVDDPNPETGRENEQVYPCYEYKYDDYGNQIEIWDNVKQYADDTVIYTRKRVTSFTHDEMGRQTSKTLPDETSTEHKWYNALGQLIKSTDFANQATYYNYKSQGQLVDKYYYYNDPLPGESFNPATFDFSNDLPAPDSSVQYNYDNLGRKKQVIDARGTTTYYYDAEGRLEQVDSPEGVVNYDHNDTTGRKDQTWANRKGDVNTVYADSGYSYDALGRLGTVTDNITLAVNTYGYDAVGNRLSLQYGNGAYGFHIYDAINRLTDLTNYTSDQKTATLSNFSYTLNNDGMRDSVEETVDVSGTAKTRTVTYDYDNLNRLLQEEAEESGQNYGYTADYTYDLVGNRTYRQVTVTNSSGMQELHTKCDYDPATDRLNWEKHRDTQIAMAVPFGDEPIYAYADGSGGAIYKTANGKSIGSFKAFMIGLPSVWGRYTLIVAWVALAITVLLPLAVRVTQRLRGKPVHRRSQFRLFTRSVCLMLAFLFIVGPNEFNTLAQADILYSNLDTSTWAVTGTTIEYDYDDNGSLIRKTTWTGEIDTGTKTQEIIYAYNLQNRLARMRTDDTPLVTTDWETTVDYEYNDSGIRVAKYEFEATFDVDGNITAIRDDGSQQEKTILYIIDAANHTGYAQTIAELTYDDMIDPDPAVDTPDSIRSYTIGDDVLAQTDNPTGTPSVQYLLYDGHGSTRQLVDGSQAILDSFSYDAYGVMLGGNPSTPAATNLLYSGEQFDTNTQQYYLRARYYDQNNGRFNRIDPYAGNSSDPQSLHKYLYCHNNPINNIDPTGMFSITNVAINIAIGAIVGSIICAAVGGLVGAYFHIVQNQSFEGIWTSIGRGALYGAIVGAILGASAGASLKLFAVALSAHFGVSLVLTSKILLDPDLRLETKAAGVLLLILQGVLIVRPIVQGFSTTSAATPSSYSGKACRVMSRAEYKLARQGRWVDSQFSDRTGHKWMWSERSTAKEWLQFVKKNGETDSVLTEISTKNPLNAYETLPHTSEPVGTMHSVPVSDIGIPRVINGGS